MTAKLIYLVVYLIEKVLEAPLTLEKFRSLCKPISLCTVFQAAQAEQLLCTLLSSSACAVWKTIHREIGSHQLHPQLHTVFKKEKVPLGSLGTLSEYCEIITILMNVNIEDP